GVEEPIDAIAVVRVVLRGVDPALGSDAMRATRAAVDEESFDVVAELGERRGGGSAGEARADDDDVELAFVGGVHEPKLESPPVPFLRDRAGGDLGIENHRGSGSTNQRQ